MGSVPCAGSSTEQVQAAVLAGLLRGQRQVKQVRQRRNVVQIAKGGAGASGAVGAAQTLLAVLPGGTSAPGFLLGQGQSRGATAPGATALLGFLVFLHLCVEAVALLLGHAAKLDGWSEKTTTAAQHTHHKHDQWSFTWTYVTSGVYL